MERMLRRPSPERLPRVSRFLAGETEGRGCAVPRFMENKAIMPEPVTLFVRARNCEGRPVQAGLDRRGGKGRLAMTPASG